MSIASEITRLQGAKADLATAIEGKGVTVPSATKLNGYADLVDAISQGGGGGTMQSKSVSYTPSTSAQSQTVTADAGYDGLSSVAVSVAAMPSGTEGTPTATKGTVSNNSITVTPSVTNSAGYIEGGTKTGTAVTVSASEVTSGYQIKTANGSYDVTNLASLIVNVSNTYTASDEGKVVSNGALVAQTSTSFTVNGTYDTTTNDEVIVNVQSGVNFDNFISNPPTFPSGEITFNGTAIRDYAFAYLAQDNSVAETWPEWSFYAPNATSIGANAFRQCRTLKQARFPSLTSPASGSYFFYQSVSGTRKLELIDWGLANIGGNWAGYCANLKTIILRKTTIATLGNINQAFQGTPFASGGSGGTIYIPKVLYDHLGDGSSSDYKAASNWATVDGYGTITWAKIEGSIYEL